MDQPAPHWSIKGFTMGNIVETLKSIAFVLFTVMIALILQATASTEETSSSSVLEDSSELQLVSASEN
jgi:hypothetical protein